jgi:general secretion pathway protein F
MLRVGERSGALAQMFNRAAAFHDAEIARLSDWVTHALNPLLMLLMGLVVGAIVVLMYLPIFQLVEQVQ